MSVNAATTAPATILPPTAAPQTVAQMLNAAAEALGAMGLKPPRLEVDALVDGAAKASGYAPPPAGRYLEPLRVLLDSAQASTTLNALGQRMLAHALHMRLKNHFAIAGWLAEHPAIEDEPIERPVFIVSLPRTGTTMLHRLLSVPSHSRALHTWEMDHPVPVPQAALAPSRGQKAAAGVWSLHQMCPDLKHIHAVGSHAPEECLHLMANALTSALFTYFYDLPGYIDYMRTVAWEPVYRAHRRQLQLLQAGQPQRRWVLKAPAHLMGLDALLRVYPDALIVQTHRDPTSIIASEASLCLSIRRAFHSETNLHRLGQERFSVLADWIDRGMAARQNHPDASFIDIHYRDLVSDPMPWATTIFERVGQTLADDDRATMQAHLDRHRQHRYGRHRYSLEQFGLREASVRTRFADYATRHLPT
ncbi:MAG: sulfotransferase [Myxococcota bacterium]